MKKRLIIGITFIVIVLALAIGISAIRNSAENSVAVDVYFFDSEISDIVAERQTVVYGKHDDIIEKTVESMIKGSKKNTNVINEGTKLNSVEEKGNLVTVDFSKEFLTEDKTRNTLAVYAVVKTLCQLPGVSEVLVTVDSENVTGADGEKLDFLSGEDINIERDSDSVENKSVALYFADNEGNLVQVIRKVKITDTQPIEQYVVNELIKGPGHSALKSVLSPDTTLISAQTTDGTCFVNFNANFVTKNSEVNSELAIYSIVNSLTELDSVKYVQLIVEGKKISSFGNVPLDGTLSRKE